MSGRIYPSVAETLETHHMLIEEFGGSHGLRDRGLLEAAVLRPQSGYYSNVIEAASALMESLVNNHAFIDGNKRISFVMTDAMLRANGYFIDVEPLPPTNLLSNLSRKVNSVLVSSVTGSRPVQNPSEQTAGFPRDVTATSPGRQVVTPPPRTAPMAAEPAQTGWLHGVTKITVFSIARAYTGKCR
jgi:death-on-curing protein